MDSRTTPITVVYDGPDRSAIRRLGRGLSATLGALLLLIGSLAALPAFGLTVAVVLTWYGSREEGHDVTRDWPAWIQDWFIPGWLGAVAATWLGLAVGLRAVRGNRRVVLFLRRFRYDAATRAATVAATSVGGFWRLVTLDDSEIAAIGADDEANDFVQKVDRARSLGRRAAKVVVAVWKVVLRISVLVAVVAIAVTAYQAEGDAAAKAERVIDLFALAAPDDEAATTVFRVAAATLVVCLALAVAWFGLVVATVVLTLPAGSFLRSVGDSVREADASKEIPIDDSTDIIAARTLVEHQRRKVFGARLIVLDVDSSVWQLTVTSLAEASTLPLIDISEPSDNVMWEIETLLRRFGRRCVFIAEDERMRLLNAPAEPGSLHARLHELLAGHEVLVYGTAGKGMKQFARALRATFEHRSRLPRPSGALPPPLPADVEREARRREAAAARDSVVKVLASGFKGQRRP